MRKIFIAFIAIAAMSLSAAAQDKGNISVGGAIGVSGGAINTAVTKAATPVSFKFNPMANMFVINDLEVSAGLNYELEKTTSKFAETKASTLFHVAQFQMGVHYYVPIVWGWFYYTPGVNLGFGGGTSETRIVSGEQKDVQKTAVPFAFDFNVNFAKFEFQPDVRWGVTVNLFDLNLRYYTIGKGEAKGDVLKTDCLFNYGCSVGVKYYF